MFGGWEETIKRIQNAKGIKPNSRFTVFYGQFWSINSNYTKDVRKFRVSLWKSMKFFLKRNISPSYQTNFKGTNDDTYKADGCFGIYQN